MLISQGNHKLGKDTLILNMTSATDCPSRALGLCSLPSKCYAMKAERMYKAVLPYRRRQAEYWDKHGPIKIASDLREELGRHTKSPIKFIRISEAGDFRAQADVTKLYIIADLLADTGVIIYGYTARKDLQFPFGPSNLVLNGSGFMLDNMFTATDPKLLKNYQVVCAGNCRICSLCKAAGKQDIKVGLH
jgi:hypothetical protein